MFARYPEGDLVFKLPKTTPDMIRSTEQELAEATRALDEIEDLIYASKNPNEPSEKAFSMLLACAPIIECVAERLRSIDPLWARAEGLKNMGHPRTLRHENDRRKTGEMEEIIQRYGGLLADNLPMDAEEDMLMPLKDDVADETVMYFPFKSGAALRCDYPSKKLSRDHYIFLQSKGLSQEHYTFLQRDEAIDTLDDALAERRATLEPQIAGYQRMRNKLRALEDAEQKTHEPASS